MSWLASADDGSRVGQNHDQHSPGNPPKPKPTSAQREHQATRSLMPLFLKATTAQLSAVKAPEEWTELEVCIDSGACESVMPYELCKHIGVVESAQSRDGVEYEVANGQSIPNLGERRCQIMTPGSMVPKLLTFQVADVHKALLSISRCADMGFECHLGQSGGFLLDKTTGEQIPLTRKDNLYMLKTWVRQNPFVRPE